MKKGTTNNPNGRPKGVANKATTNAREAIASFVEGNTDRLNRLLDTIENGLKKDDGDGYLVFPNPKGAFDSIMAVVEYHIPKLARTESHIMGEGGGPVQHEVKVSFVDGHSNTEGV